MNKINQRGMSLVETLIALGIFSLVVVFTIGLFISGIKAQSAAGEMNLVNSEATFLLERISREIRMARNTDDIDVASNNRGITFRDHSGILTGFCQVNSSGNCNLSGESIGVIYDDDDDGLGDDSYVFLSSENIKVNSLKIFYSGDPPNKQPIITIVLRISSKKYPNIVTLMQTSVTPRVY